MKLIIKTDGFQYKLRIVIIFCVAFTMGQVLAGDNMLDQENSTSQTLPQWSDYMAILNKSDQLLDKLAGSDNQANRQRLYQLLAKSLATGFFSSFDDPNYPDFVPAVNTLLNTVGANPDFIYGYTKVDGTGVYRLSGFRGEGLFLLFDLVAGGFGVGDTFGPSVGMLDIDEFTLGKKGEFDILLSAQRPQGYSGDWYKMDAATKTINVRQASYHWGVDIEARIAIERTDINHQRKSLDEQAIAKRLEALMAYPQFYTGFSLGFINQLREKGLVNKLEHDDWAGKGGVEGQHYYQGLFELQPGHVLVLETELPETVRYWNIQLTDNLWNSIDWMNHQSSLNAAQAVIDTDGRFRAVIASQDPGVANWLDTGGFAEGTLMLRWTGASSGPVPTLRSVPLSELSKQLPADTVLVSAEKRQEALRERRRNVQWRRRW